MTQTTTERVTLAVQEDLGALRRAITAAAERLDFRAVERTKLVTAASELGRNAIVHGGGGWATVAIDDEEQRSRLVFEIVDYGPGIADLDQAFVDGFTTARGLGLGLGGARRLVDGCMDVETERGKGTRIRCWRWA